MYSEKLAVIPQDKIFDTDTAAGPLNENDMD